MSLDPLKLSSECSLNRVRIVDLPHYPLPEALKNKLAFDLLGAQALAATPADEAGRRLGYLLLTLKRGDAINRAARLDWDDSYWQHWARVESVWIGGGQVSGERGEMICALAQQTVRDNHFPNFRVLLADHPRALPLIGAARYLPVNRAANAVVVLDFGGTAVKRACALYRDAELTHLHMFSPLPTSCDQELPAHVDAMLTCIADTITDSQRIGYQPAYTLMLSVASYTPDGQPVSGTGCYDRLRDLTDNVRGYFSHRLRERVGHDIQVQFIHDGTAAAAVYAGNPNSVVIMLGTSIGYGFPPPFDLVRSMAAPLEITTHS